MRAALPWILSLLLLAAACRSASAPPSPEELQFEYLGLVARSTPPVLRGRVVNRAGTAMKELELQVFYGVGAETELESLVLQDLKPGVPREFDFPLGKVDRQPTTFRVEPFRVEWAD